ncbi:MAG TPA: FAD-dependent monooxygenase, partial [Candidatus Tumulicola sp.]|nr:FAD-dependent monooxygenase [Candidatus Tumulicola sp.]
FVIAKGTFDAMKAAGLAAFRETLASLSPAIADRVGAIDDWSKVSLLEVRVDRLTRWHRPGLLCIGDAAHAMSPIGGVGINLAVQDAVAAANELAAPLLAGAGTDAALESIQTRRTFPTKVTQGFQLFIQDRAIHPLLHGFEMTHPPAPLHWLDEFPYLRRFPARLIGMGARPEHVRTPNAF